VAAASWSPESFVASTAKRFGVIKTFDFLSVRLGDSDELDKFLLDGLGVRARNGARITGAVVHY